MVKKRVRGVLYSLPFVSASLFSSGAMAKVPPVAFKGVTEYFKEGMEFMSPTLGEVALEKGLIHNLRFYGDFKGGIKEGHPDHIKDTSEDPT